MDFLVLVLAFAVWVLLLMLFTWPWVGAAFAVGLTGVTVIVARICLFVADQPPRFRVAPPPRPAQHSRPVETGVLDYETKA